MSKWLCDQSSIPFRSCPNIAKVNKNVDFWFYYQNWVLKWLKLDINLKETRWKWILKLVLSAWPWELLVAIANEIEAPWICSGQFWKLNTITTFLHLGCLYGQKVTWLNCHTVLHCHFTTAATVLCVYSSAGKCRAAFLRIKIVKSLQASKKFGEKLDVHGGNYS